MVPLLHIEGLLHVSRQNLLGEADSLSAPRGGPAHHHAGLGVALHRNLGLALLLDLPHYCPPRADEEADLLCGDRHPLQAPLVDEGREGKPRGGALIGGPSNEAEIVVSLELHARPRLLFDLLDLAAVGADEHRVVFPPHLVLLLLHLADLSEDILGHLPRRRAPLHRPSEIVPHPLFRHPPGQQLRQVGALPAIVSVSAEEREVGALDFFLLAHAPGLY
mmetsp:Transcript_33315/g.76167  ORF Transcript_33315/g.76167 Transcript_33315/m.76167 type:complete len:220 (-) Transcript_33315:63-722(-)